MTAQVATLEDLARRNATFLNARRLDGPAALRDGDQITIRDETMVFCASAPGTTRDAGR